MSIQFFQTIMGRQFIDGTMPRIARALDRIADALDREAESEVIEMIAADPRVRDRLDADAHPQWGDHPTSQADWRRRVVAAYRAAQEASDA